MDEYEISEVNLGRNKYICFEPFEVWSLNFSLKEEAMKNIQCGKQSKRGYVVMLCCCVGYVVMLFNLVSSNARYIFYPERVIKVLV